MKRQKRVNWMKVSALVLAASLTLVGCGKDDSGAQSTTSTSEAPTITLDWVNYPGVTTESNYATQYLEKKFNVKLNKAYTTAQKDYKQKLQLQLSSGEIPDVMFVFDPGELNKYASQGLLAEVPLADIEKYAPRTKANLDKQAPQGWYYSNVNGKNYGLPTFYFSGQFNSKQLWRTDLLKQAGIEKVPETIDEFTAAFAALKKNRRLWNEYEWQFVL